MAIALLDSDAVGFSDGNAGHGYTFPLGAPSANDLDVLCVNSDTVITTPTGFGIATSFVSGQGSYLYWRKAAGGEAGSTTITSSGDFPVALVWSRWSGVNTFDVGVNAHIDASAGTSSPAVSTGTLAGSGELVIAHLALHGFPGSAPTTPVWSSGYGPLESIAQGTGAGGSAGFVGYRTDAGTGSESPTVTWTNSATDRYMLVATFTAAVIAALPTRPQVVNAAAVTRSRSW